MFKFISIGLFLFLSNSLVAQDWLKDTCTLKGKVKSMVHITISNLNLPKEHWDTMDLSYEYNAQGFLVRYNISASFLGKNVNTEYRVYDEAGTQCLTEYELQDGDTASRYDFIYNERDKLEVMKLYRWGKLIRTFNYKHNELGLLIEYSVYIPEASYTSYHYYSYDEAGRKIGESEIHNTTKEIRSWKYDENGYLVEEQLIDSNWAKSTTIKMNEKGKVKQKKTIDYSNNANTAGSYTLKFTRNEKGQVVLELRLDGNGNPTSEKKYTYNDLGEVETMIYYSYEKDKSSDFSYTYKYDQQENWISKSSFLSGTLIQEEERSIAYH